MTATPVVSRTAFQAQVSPLHILQWISLDKVIHTWGNLFYTTVFVSCKYSIRCIKDTMYHWLFMSMYNSASLKQKKCRSLWLMTKGRQSGWNLHREPFSAIGGPSLIIRVRGSLETGTVSPANLWPPYHQSIVFTTPPIDPLLILRNYDPPIFGW